MRDLSSMAVGGVVRPRSAAEQAWFLRAARKHSVERILPGIYGPPGALGDLRARIQAAHLMDPDSVITRESAAKVLWWPEIAGGPVNVARRVRTIARPGFRFEERVIPPDLIVTRGGISYACPELAVLDLIPILGGNVIDEALRRRAVTLRGVWHAFDLLPARRGDALRRDLLLDSRDEPWSEAERHLHRAYRDSGFRFTHATNYWVTLTDGRRTPLDFALPQISLAFEADGYQFHGSRAAFEYDRDRDSDLATLGWHVVRFSADFLMGPLVQVTQRLQAIVTVRASLFGLASRARLPPDRSSESSQGQGSM